MENEVAEKAPQAEQNCIDLFFANYPREEEYDDTDVINTKLNRMVDSIKELRQLAIDSKSLYWLEKARSMDLEAGSLVTMLRNRLLTKQHEKGILLAHGNVPKTLGSPEWQK